MTEYRRPPEIVSVATNFSSIDMPVIAVGLRTPADVAWIIRAIADLFGAPVSDSLRDMGAALASVRVHAPNYLVSLQKDGSLLADTFWIFPGPYHAKVAAVTTHAPHVDNFKADKKRWTDNFSIAPDLRKMLEGDDWP
jgi:hypothetical protein